MAITRVKMIKSNKAMTLTEGKIYDLTPGQLENLEAFTDYQPIGTLPVTPKVLEANPIEPAPAKKTRLKNTKD